jgi:hypothetical protein
MKKMSFIAIMLAAILFASMATAADEGKSAEKPKAEAKATAAPAAGGSTDNGPTIKFYGYLKFDAAYDSAYTSTGDYARWVESEALNSDDNQLSITPRESRFGLQFNGPDSETLKISGKVEVDFYEGGSDNKARLMMRHAFLQLDWTKLDLSIIAGQTSDVISPLVAPTINYTVGWWVGNIGYRRPQLRITKGLAVGENQKLTLAGAVARNIGHTTAFGSGDSGKDSGIPIFEGRVGYSFPLVAGKKAELGFSAHWGREEFDLNSAGDNTQYDTWSANFDFSIPLASSVLVKGEVFTGQNLDAFLGGIGQGINTATMEEISSTGGWASLSLGPWKDWRFNIAGSVDNPDDADLSNGARTLNSSFWGNAAYDITKNVWVGVELGYWKTEYKNLADGDSVRVQFAVAYKF